MAAKKTKKAAKKSSKKKTAKRAGGRPPKGTPTKADFIRAKLAEGLTGAAIVKAAADAGLQVQASQVYKLKGKGSAKRGPGRQAASAPKGGKPTASDFIRQHPDKPAGEIVKLGAAKGLKFTESSVYQTRAYDKKKGGAPKGKPGRKPGGNVATRATGGGDLAAFKKMAVTIGFPEAREIVAELEKRYNELLA